MSEAEVMDLRELMTLYVLMYICGQDMNQFNGNIAQNSSLRYNAPDFSPAKLKHDDLHP